MAEQISRDVFRIGVPLPRSPLKELNSWFIRGTERDLLIDTGLRCDECRDALTRGLAEIGSDAARRDVLITHLHADHSGMADLFAASDARIYMSGADLSYMRDSLGEGCIERIEADYIIEGTPRHDLDVIFETSREAWSILPELDERWVPLDSGDTIDVGGCVLEAIVTPGHTPGNFVFFDRARKLMFCGDHVLFDITPNITRWSFVDDSLGNYLNSLERVRGMDVETALPGHRHQGDLAARIDEIEAHHQKRLAEVRSILASHPGASAYEIASMMTWSIRARSWDDFPVSQRWFAVGECMAHLDHLLAQGEIAYALEGGVRRWRNA